MSEGDYLNFQRERASQKSALANKVDISLSDENQFNRQGTLNFLDNTLDRSSGTIHARATVPNSDLALDSRIVRSGSSEPAVFAPSASSFRMPPYRADQTDRMVLVVGPDGVVEGEEGPDRRSSLRFARHLLRTGTSSDRVVIGGPPVAPGAKVLPRDDTIAVGSDEGSN